MACCTISYFGKVGTWTNAEATILLPDRVASSEPLPVLYLLHDTHDNHTTLARMTMLGSHVRDLPLVAVLPDAERGYYTDTTPGHAHEQLFIQDMMGFKGRR